MSILIKGIDMPKTGVYVLSVDNTGKDKTIFTIAEHTHSGKIIPRHVGEALPVPPHGDLIERKPLEKKVKLLNAHYSYREVVEYADIHYAPTIIEAEGE